MVYGSGAILSILLRREASRVVALQSWESSNTVEARYKDYR